MGPLKAHLAGNDVTSSSGRRSRTPTTSTTHTTAFHAENIGIEDVLHQVGNAVMLWRLHPSTPISHASPTASSSAFLGEEPAEPEQEDDEQHDRLLGRHRDAAELLVGQWR